MTDDEIGRYLGIYFLVITGCRPVEAAHVVFNKTIEQFNETYYEEWGKPAYKALASDTMTKTKKTYKWLLTSK